MNKSTDYFKSPEIEAFVETQLVPRLIPSTLKSLGLLKLDLVNTANGSYTEFSELNDWETFRKKHDKGSILFQYRADLEVLSAHLYTKVRPLFEENLHLFGLEERASKEQFWVDEIVKDNDPEVFGFDRYVLWFFNMDKEITISDYVRIESSHPMSPSETEEDAYSFRSAVMQSKFHLMCYDLYNWERA